MECLRQRPSYVSTHFPLAQTAVTFFRLYRIEPPGHGVRNCSLTVETLMWVPEPTKIRASIYGSRCQPQPDCHRARPDSGWRPDRPANRLSPHLGEAFWYLPTYLG